MYGRKRIGAAAAAALGVAALAVGATQQGAVAKEPAKAAVKGSPHHTGTPTFLEPGELPPYAYSPWYAGPVTAGLPEYGVFCAQDGVLPQRGTSHREFGTEMDTGALQVVVTTRSTDAAKRLAARLAASIRNCAATFERQIPGAWADWKDLGPVEAEDGAWTAAVATSVPESENGIALFGVGRDGATVTLVRWSQMGGFADAPEAAFKQTTATAVNKLYN
ncbi:hypothetical protein ACFQLX_11660 [Streptomyces polyrhachis]|uniref:PknH-like extracellular domain-containing protein n=1 Tax=Streptomyces polyrhachis TaxID=1282885 RepID=A0ABW2GGC8_9ACTN